MNRSLLLIVGIIAGGLTLQATPISGYGDPLLNASLLGGTQEGFDTTTSGLYMSATWGNLTITSLTPNVPYTIGPTYNGNYNTTGGKSIFNDSDNTPFAFQFGFATPVSAFAFNWGAADRYWTLKTYDTSNTLLETISITPTYSSNSGEYFGATGAISYATLTNNDNGPTDYVFIDRVTYKTAENVPDSSTTVALLGVAFASLAAVRSRRRNGSAASSQQHLGRIELQP